MVVMAIISILAATVIVNFGRNPDRDVRLEKDKLVTFLRSVQNMALSGEQMPKADVSGCYDASDKYICNVCGYGVEMAANNIQVYFLKKALIDDSCTNIASLTKSNYTNKIFYPGNGVTVSLHDAADKIFFLIPNGNIYYNGSLYNGSVPWDEINITLLKTPATVPVTITPGGIIK